MSRDCLFIGVILAVFCVVQEAVCRFELPFVATTDEFVAGERECRLYWPTDGHCGGDNGNCNGV